MKHAHSPRTSNRACWAMTPYTAFLPELPHVQRKLHLFPSLLDRVLHDCSSIKRYASPPLVAPSPHVPEETLPVDKPTTI